MRLVPRASIQAIPQARTADISVFNLKGCTDSLSQISKFFSLLLDLD